MHGFVRAKSALGVLDLENSEVVVVSVERLKPRGINLVLQFGYSEVLDFNWVGHCPLQANGNRRQVVSMLEELELGTTLEGLSLELNGKRLSVTDLEEDVQVVLAHVLGVVQNAQVHLLSRGEGSLLGLDREDLVLQDVFLEGLFLAWFPGISPRLHLDLRVIWHLELPLSLNATDVLQSKRDSAGLCSVLDRHLAEIPDELFESCLQFVVTLVGLV